MTKWKGVAASFAPHVAQLTMAGTLLTGLAAGSAFAADRYWDVNQSAPNRGGSGTWDLSSFYWSSNGDGASGPYNQAWNNNGIVSDTIDNAIFGGTAGTVTLGSPITVQNMTFGTVTRSPVAR